MARDVRKRTAPRPPRGDALDQLEYEDRALLEILDEFERQDDRLKHGVAGKLFVEHLAVREAAREAVAEALAGEPAVADLAGRLEHGVSDRRGALSRLDELARGVQPINLNQGQSFDAVAKPIAWEVRREAHDDLEDLVPLIRSRLTRAQTDRLLPSARWTRRHAPTHPHPAGRRGYERFKPFVWLHALYDWLRGFPTGGAKPSTEVELPANDNRPV